METMEILKKSTVEGNIVKLPDIQLDRKQYLEVKNKLELIGGKWKGGKTAGFVFEENPTELINQISNGRDVNLKKEFQFFETPEKIADMLVSHADIQDDDSILEPSAGRGVIIEAINRVKDFKLVDCYEIMELNRSFLEKLDTSNVIGSDFLKSEKLNSYHKIIANPPFSKNQDIIHVRKMYECLMPGGTLVSIMSNHWKTSQNRKETEFRAWLASQNHQGYELDSEEFKESGTKISTCIIVIIKPLA